jgi:hypothetical protein
METKRERASLLSQTDGTFIVCVQNTNDEENESVDGTAQDQLP